MLPVLRGIGGDVNIRHHWTGDRLKLHLFRHKGYWYHGRKRELDTMLLFADLISPGDFVVEIGGHIGYVSIYLAKLVGPSGRVVVFEPAPDNLRYINANVARFTEVTVISQAVSDRTGKAQLYVEELTGQNNSLLNDYAVFEENQKWAFVQTKKKSVEVRCTTLDDFIRESDLPRPSLIKIDVEGAEHLVLQGMQETLRRSGVALMVEVTERNAEVVRLLRDAGFALFRPDRRPISLMESVRGNVFCVKPNDRRTAELTRRVPS